MDKKIDFFYLGPPKSGSSWLFRCLESHPDINASKQDEIYFFDRFYARGEAWLDRFYNADHNGKRIDCTPTTIYNLRALRRAIDHNPNAKFAFGLRHPVERSFSAYWHVKKKNKINWNFQDILTDYYPYQAFLESSWIAEGLAYLQSRVADNQIYCMDFDRIAAQPSQVIQEIYQFIGVQDDHKPPMLHKKINAAGAKQSLHTRIGSKIAAILFGQDKGQNINAIESFLSGKQELYKGIDPDTYNALLDLCEPEIAHLETLLGRDLTSWRTRKKV